MIELFYYLEDDSLQVSEPRQANSGMPQGLVIKRHRVPRTSTPHTHHTLIYRDAEREREIACEYRPHAGGRAPAQAHHRSARRLRARAQAHAARAALPHLPRLPGRRPGLALYAHARNPHHSLITGETSDRLLVFTDGRTYMLTDADPFTKEFYAETLGSPLSAPQPV